MGGTLPYPSPPPKNIGGGDVSPRPPEIAAHYMTMVMVMVMIMAMAMVMAIVMLCLRLCLCLWSWLCL